MRKKNNVLAFALQSRAAQVRTEEKKCRAQLEAFADKTQPLAIVTEVLAELHAKAAGVYENALAVLERGAL